MKKLLLILPAIFLLACGDDTDNTGGCAYEVDTIGATIIRMDSTETPYPDIVVQVSYANGELDSIRYTNNRNENVTWDTAIARGYKIGVKLKTQHYLITRGHCDPEYFIVMKEVYKH